MNDFQKDVVLIVIFLIFMFVAGGIMGWIARDSKIIYFNSNKVLISNNNFSDTNCSNMSLFNTSKCLRDELSQFYFYNISNLGKDLTLEQLKSEGGVCHNAAQYYINKIDNIKFYSTDISIDTSINTSHEFVIISNKEGWCYLDQTNYGCNYFDN